MMRTLTAAALPEIGFCNVQFFNIGLLTMKLSAMQSRIEGLERELAEARGKK